MTLLTVDTLRERFAGQYTLERELGRGGMGVVFLARELSLDRLVAVKVLPPALAEDPATRERFLREARTAAQLAHPNIVSIHRADTLDEIVYFAMTFVDGETLAQRLEARGPLSPSEAVRILREVAWALAYAHARGVVHRDVKPENILLERGTGRVIVTDFGIARDRRTTSLTADGTVLGSVHYMSPEQVAAEALDGRSDLYSLGVVAFQILSGVLPFDAPVASAVLIKHVTQAAPSLRSVAPHLSESLAQVIDRCLRKEPEQRFETGEALAEALTHALQASQSDPQQVVDRVLDEETAKGVWLRAAQLQADAARRVRDRSVSAAEVASGFHTAAMANTSGYRVADVEAAGVEAGIAGEFIQLALAELPAVAGVAAAGGGIGNVRFAETILGALEHSIQVSRVIGASPVRTLELVGQVFPGAPWNLLFRDTVGGLPLEGGVLTFDLLEVGAPQYLGATLSGLQYHFSVIDAYQILTTLRPIDGDPQRCELTVTADLRPGIRKNAKAGAWFGGVVGTVAALFGGAVAIGTGAGLVAAPIAAGALAVGGTGMVGFYRVLYRWSVSRARADLGKLLDSVNAQARSREIFGLPAGTAPRIGVRPAE